MIQFDEEKMELMNSIGWHARKQIGKIGNGTDSKDGIYSVFQEVMNYFVDEFQEGYGNKIEVRIDEKQKVTIRDYGRGMGFEERYANSKSPKKTMEVTGFGIDAVYVLCGGVEMYVYKDKIREHRFYSHNIQSHSDKRKTREKDGLSIVFDFYHRMLFMKYWFDDGILLNMLQNISYLNPGLEIVYIRDYMKVRMKSKEGLVDLLKDKQQLKGEYLYPIIHLSDERMEVALTHSCANDSRMYLFVNGRFVEQDNPCFLAYREILVNALLKYYYFESFSAEDVLSGLIGAISIYIDENESVTDRMKDFFSKELWLYLFRNTRVSDMFLMKMNIAKNKRELLSRY